MRTIASTFDTREQAETVSRRLQEIGVAPESIALKDLSATADASAAGGDGDSPSGEAPARGIFLSAKVSAEQMAAATEILKGGERDSGSAPMRPSTSDASAFEGRSQSPLQENRVPASDAHVAHVPPQPRPQVQREPQRTSVRPDAVPRSATDWRSTARRIVILGLLFVAAVVVGRLLGEIIY